MGIIEDLEAGLRQQLQPDEDGPEIEFELHLERWDGGRDVKTFKRAGVNEAWEYAATFFPEYKAVDFMLNLNAIRETGGEVDVVRAEWLRRLKIKM
jgi:hypothetical protein